MKKSYMFVGFLSLALILVALKPDVSPQYIILMVITGILLDIRGYLEQILSKN